MFKMTDAVILTSAASFFVELSPAFKNCMPNRGLIKVVKKHMVRPA